MEKDFEICSSVVASSLGHLRSQCSTVCGSSLQRGHRGNVESGVVAIVATMPGVQSIELATGYFTWAVTITFGVVIHTLETVGFIWRLNSSQSRSVGLSMNP